MRKGGIKASLERLEACTGRIDTWIDRAGRNMVELTSNRSPLKFIDLLDTIRENATRIYSALCQSWCKANPKHPTLLLMEQRLKRSRPIRKAQPDSVLSMVADSTCFKVSINEGCCLPLQQFNTEFRVVELSPRYILLKSQLISPIEFWTLIVLRGSKVRVTVSTTQGSSLDPPYNDPSTLPQITNFCRYIQQPPHASAGFCLDNMGSLRVYSSPSPSIQYADQRMTLESLLPSLQRKLPLEESYCLVITLVASVFQLSHTP